jgi:hypothetical protein
MKQNNSCTYIDIIIIYYFIDNKITEKWINIYL